MNSKKIDLGQGAFSTNEVVSLAQWKDLINGYLAAQERWRDVRATRHAQNRPIEDILDEDDAELRLHYAKALLASALRSARPKWQGAREKGWYLARSHKAQTIWLCHNRFPVVEMPMSGGSSIWIRTPTHAERVDHANRRKALTVLRDQAFKACVRAMLLGADPRDKGWRFEEGQKGGVWKHRSFSGVRVPARAARKAAEKESLLLQIRWANERLRGRAA